MTGQEAGDDRAGGGCRTGGGKGRGRARWQAKEEGAGASEQGAIELLSSPYLDLILDPLCVPGLQGPTAR